MPVRSPTMDDTHVDAGRVGRCTIILVHGTWGRGFCPKRREVSLYPPNKRWWFEEGSQFRTGLDEALKSASLDWPIRPFLWSGANSVHARDYAAIQAAAANRDQDRYVMITFPTSQIQNPVLPRRPSIRHGGARANMPLPRQRRHRSSWLTADSRTCDGPIMRRNVVSQHTHRRRLPSPTSVVHNLHSARALAAPPPAISRGFLH